MKQNLLFVFSIILLASCQSREVYKGDDFQGEWNISNSMNLTVDSDKKYSLQVGYSSLTEYNGYLYTTRSQTDMITLLNGTGSVQYVIKPISDHFVFFEYEGNGLDPGKPIGILSNQDPDVNDNFIEFLQGYWINILDTNDEITFEDSAYNRYDSSLNHTVTRFISQYETRIENRRYLIGVTSYQGIARHQTLDLYIHSDDVISFDSEIGGMWIGRDFFERR